MDNKTLGQQIIGAHQHSKEHKDELLQSKICGCFCCISTFSSQDIEDWIDDETTAICPECGIDSIIGDASGYPVSIRFLQAMNERCFN